MFTRDTEINPRLVPGFKTFYFPCKTEDWGLSPSRSRLLGLVEEGSWWWREHSGPGSGGGGPDDQALLTGHRDAPDEVQELLEVQLPIAVQIEFLHHPVQDPGVLLVLQKTRETGIGVGLEAKVPLTEPCPVPTAPGMELLPLCSPPSPTPRCLVGLEALTAAPGAKHSYRGLFFWPGFCSQDH